MINLKLRLKAEEGTLADVLRAEIELEQVRILAANAEATYRAAWTRLGAAVGRPHLAAETLKDSLALSVRDRERVKTLEVIVAQSPELMAAQAGIRRAEAALARAHAEPIPNVTIEAGTQYDYGTRDQIASIGISLPLPIYNRNEGNIVAAQSDLSRARREVDRVKLSLADRFASAYANYQKALQQVERYGTRLAEAEITRILGLMHEERQRELDKHPQILPRAQLVLALATEGWQGGEFGYLEVLTAQRTLTQVSLDYLRSQAALRQAKVALDGYLLAGSVLAPSSAGSAQISTSDASGSD
jgi:cobalt-zinc-cadmium efflux system outer membrane protein